MNDILLALVGLQKSGVFGKMTSSINKKLPNHLNLNSFIVLDKNKKFELTVRKKTFYNGNQIDQKI